MARVEDTSSNLLARPSTAKMPVAPRTSDVGLQARSVSESVSETTCFSTGLIRSAKGVPRPLRPRPRHDLPGVLAEEQGVALPGHLVDRRAQDLGVEEGHRSPTVAEVPVVVVLGRAGFLDEAVEGDELADHDPHTGVDDVTGPDSSLLWPP